MSRRRQEGIGLQAIAERAGVSLATVSLALSDHPQVNAQTRQTIQALSQELGYCTAGELARRRLRRRLRRIGFVAVGSRLHEGHEAFVVPLTQALQDCGASLELATIPPAMGRDEQIAAVRQFAAGLDALLITDAIDIPFLVALDGLEMPVIAFGHVIRGQAPPGARLRAQVIAPDDVGLARQAVSWLLRQGHRSIGFAAPWASPGAADDRQREGYRLALLEAGLPLTPAHELVGLDIAAVPAGPTAWYVTDARLCVRLLAALRAAGLALPAAAVVVRGPRVQLCDCGVAHHPHVELDLAAMATTAAALLTRLDRQALAEGLQILLPLPLHHMP